MQASQYQRAETKTRNQAAGESSAKLSAAVLWIRLSRKTISLRRETDIQDFVHLRVGSVLDMKKAREV